MNKAVISIAVFLCFSETLFAQQNTLSAGGEASSTSGTVSYSIGQIAYMNNTNISATVTDGVQQPYEIYVLDMNDEYESIALIAYPNPTTDLFFVQLSDMGDRTFSYSLTDFQGKILSHNLITQSLFNIDMTGFASGNYYLQIIDVEENTSKTISIIKK